MKYIDGSPTLCETVYRIYAYDPNPKTEGWCLSFLGSHKTQAEAEDAITEYLRAPENQSRDREVFQVRLNMTSSTLVSNIVWNPNGTIETMEQFTDTVK